MAVAAPLQVMPCHVMVSHVVSCHVMSCHGMSWHVMSCHVMSCQVRSCHVRSWHAMSCHRRPAPGHRWRRRLQPRPRRAASCHVMSCHATAQTCCVWGAHAGEGAGVLSLWGVCAISWLRWVYGSVSRHGYGTTLCTHGYGTTLCNVMSCHLWHYAVQEDSGRAHSTCWGTERQLKGGTKGKLKGGTKGQLTAAAHTAHGLLACCPPPPAALRGPCGPSSDACLRLLKHGLPDPSAPSGVQAHPQHSPKP